MFSFFPVPLFSAEKNAFPVKGGECRLFCRPGEGSVQLYSAHLMYPKALWCLKMCLDSWPWHIMSAASELGLGSGKSRQAWGLVAFSWLNTCNCYDPMAKLWHRLTGQDDSDPLTQWWFFSLLLITIALQQVREIFREQVSMWNAFNAWHYVLCSALNLFPCLLTSTDKFSLVNSF